MSTNKCSKSWLRIKLSILRLFSLRNQGRTVPILYTLLLGLQPSDSPINSSIIRPLPHQFTNHGLQIGPSSSEAVSRRHNCANEKHAWRSALLRKEAERARTMPWADLRVPTIFGFARGWSASITYHLLPTVPTTLGFRGLYVWVT